MADVFGNDRGKRGCFMAISMDSSNSLGATLQLPSGNIPSRFADPHLVVGFSTAASEAVRHMKSLGGSVYTYAFGHDPNQGVLDVSVAAFIGGDSSAVRTLLDAYKTSRVSKALAPVRFAIGNAVISGYLVAQASQTQSAEHNIQMFNFRIARTEL